MDEHRDKELPDLFSVNAILSAAINAAIKSNKSLTSVEAVLKGDNGAELLFIFRLTEERQLFGKQLGRVCVPVIAVSVGDEHSFHVLQEFLRRNLQRYERVLARVGRILDGGSRACVIEHGIHDHRAAVVFDDERSMADKAKTYLDRVVQEHSGTPWAKIAEEELKLPLGWAWEETAESGPPEPKGKKKGK